MVSSASEKPVSQAESAAGELEKLRDALEVVMQAVRELDHAIVAGPEWYTNGRAGMRAQTSMWVWKAREAYRSVTAPAVSSEPLDNSNVADEK